MFEGGSPDAVRRFFSPIPIPTSLAEEYANFRLRRQETITVPALVLGTAILLSLLIVDLAIIPDAFWVGLALRVGCCLPASVAALLYLRSRRRAIRDHEAIASFFPVLFGALACTIVTSSSAPLAPVYLTANNVTVLFSTLILGLTLRYAALSASALIAVQAAILTRASFASPSVIFLITSISVATALVGLYGGLRIDREQRLQFLARQKDKHQLRKLAAQNKMLERLSALDPLTGLSNRRAFDAMLASALEDARAEPATQALAVAMVDVDHFKLFNDFLGHTAGDDALKAVAGALSAACIEEDMVARYGGEEFAIIVPVACPRLLELWGARLRASIEREGIAHPASPTARTVTASIGIVYVDREYLDSANARSLLRTADAALYRAKHRGRNGVVISRYCGDPHLNADSGNQATAV